MTKVEKISWWQQLIGRMIHGYDLRNAALDDLSDELVAADEYHDELDEVTTWVLDSEIKQKLKAIFQVDRLDSKSIRKTDRREWDAMIRSANEAAYMTIVDSLLERGYGGSAIISWVERFKFNLNLAIAFLMMKVEGGENYPDDHFKLMKGLKTAGIISSEETFKNDPLYQKQRLLDCYRCGSAFYKRWRPS